MSRKLKLWFIEFTRGEARRPRWAGSGPYNAPIMGRREPTGASGGLRHVRRRVLTVTVCAGLGGLVLGGTAVTAGAAQSRPTSPAPAGTPPVQVEFWHIFPDAPRRQWMLDRAAEFGRLHPGIQVRPVAHANYPQTFQALATAARTGQAPALVQISEAGTQLAVDSMLFRPLPMAAGRQLQDMLPSVLNYYRVGGQLYGLPFNASSPVLYANTSLLRRAGITAARLPDTLEALMHTCSTLKRAAKQVGCLTFPVDAWYFEQWAAQQGALWVDGGNGRQARATKAFLTGAAVERPLRWLGQMNRSGHYVNTGKREDNAGVTQLFLSGRVAFLMTPPRASGRCWGAARRAASRCRWVRCRCPRAARDRAWWWGAAACGFRERSRPKRRRRPRPLPCT
jgi:sn-glycerol 3-phosphate transport system substrate-binding protein